MTDSSEILYGTASPQPCMVCGRLIPDAVARQQLGYLDPGSDGRGRKLGLWFTELSNNGVVLPANPDSSLTTVYVPDGIVDCGGVLCPKYTATGCFRRVEDHLYQLFEKDQMVRDVPESDEGLIDWCARVQVHLPRLVKQGITEIRELTVTDDGWTQNLLNSPLFPLYAIHNPTKLLDFPQDEVLRRLVGAIKDAYYARYHSMEAAKTWLGNQDGPIPSRGAGR